jgi:hypothetical protein
MKSRPSFFFFWAFTFTRNGLVVGDYDDCSIVLPFDFFMKQHMDREERGRSGVRESTSAQCIAVADALTANLMG